MVEKPEVTVFLYGRNYPVTAHGKSELLMLHREILLVQSKHCNHQPSKFIFFLSGHFGH